MKDYIIPILLLITWLFASFNFGRMYEYNRAPKVDGEPFTFCLSYINGIKSAVALTPHENGYCEEGTSVFRIYNVGKAARYELE